MTHPTDQRAALEPCPFCGGRVKLREVKHLTPPRWGISHLNDCEVEPGWDIMWGSEAEAIAAWNRRTPQ